MSSTGLTSSVPDALRLAGTLLQLMRMLEQQLRRGGGATALTLTELSVLHQIDRGVDLPSQVARALRLDPARVTQLTDRLAAQGYIERTPDRLDRRCWRLGLTPAGQHRLHEGRAELRAAVAGLLDGLTGEERDGMVVGLEGVRRVLDTLPPTVPATGAPSSRVS